MHGTKDELRANLEQIRLGIGRATFRSGRRPEDVTLVAASKMVPAETMRWVAELGVREFGENYVNELRDKRTMLDGVRWHFIGTLQTNTAHHVAAYADVVQTLSGDRGVARLARRAAEVGRRLDALIEVDFTGERTGIPPVETPAFADRVAGLEGLRLVGLMTLPPIPADPEDARPYFRGLRELRDRVHRDHPGVLDLSMGMSLDYEVAVEEGATMVRIGTALFGPRTA